MTAGGWGVSYGRRVYGYIGCTRAPHTQPLKQNGPTTAYQLLVYLHTDLLTINSLEIEAGVAAGRGWEGWGGVDGRADE